MAIQSSANQDKKRFEEPDMSKKSQKLSKDVEKHSSKNQPEEVVVEIKPMYVFVFLGFIAALAALFVIFGAPSGGTTPTTPETFQDSLVTTKATLQDAVIKGKEDAPITIIEFSDYECPFCKMHSTGYDPRTGLQEEKSVMQQIQEEYIDKGLVKYAFKPFAAVPTHNPAFANEAVASSCALEQNKFWEYHESLFEKTRANGLGIDGKRAEEDSLVSLAGELGLDTNKFRDCYKRRNMDVISRTESYVKNTIKPDYDKKKQNVGTPLFVICKTPKDGAVECTGKSFAGAAPFESFKQVIEIVQKENN